MAAAKLIIIGEVDIMCIFAAMPESVSNWNKNFYKDATAHWKNAFAKLQDGTTSRYW